MSHYYLSHEKSFKTKCEKHTVSNLSEINIVVTKVDVSANGGLSGWVCQWAK